MLYACFHCLAFRSLSLYLGSPRLFPPSLFPRAIFYSRFPSYNFFFLIWPLSVHVVVTVIVDTVVVVVIIIVKANKR